GASAGDGGVVSAADSYYGRNNFVLEPFWADCAEGDGVDDAGWAGSTAGDGGGWVSGGGEGGSGYSAAAALALPSVDACSECDEAGQGQEEAANEGLTL